MRHRHYDARSPSCPNAITQTLRLLSDRSFEKRKAGAHEVEILCRRLRETNNKDAVRKLVVRRRRLRSQYAWIGAPVRTMLSHAW